MANGVQVAVATTAVAVVTGDGYARDATVKNGGPNTVYLGGSAVTPSTGYALAAADAPLRVRVGENEMVFGICAASESATVHVLS